MVFRALVLDVDGTLAETSEVRRAAFNRAFEEFRLGWFWTRAMFRAIQKNALPGREIEYFATNHSPVLFKSLKEDDKIPALREFQENTYVDYLDGGAAPLRPGVARLIADAVASDITLALCSTARRLEFETLIFNHFGREMLDGIKISVAREDLHEVSLRSAYAMVRRRLDCAVDQIIAIDDSGEGIAAASALGMATIAVPGAFSGSQNYDSAALVLSDFGHPAAPFNVLKGAYAGPGHLSVDGLRIWHISHSILKESAA